MSKEVIEPVWDDSRAEELHALQTLLRGISMANRATNFLDRISSCITIAEALTASDLKTGRPSFVGFLTEQAIKSRKEGAE